MNEKQSYITWREQIKLQTSKIRDIATNEMPQKSMNHPDVLEYTMGIPYHSVISELIHSTLSTISGILEIVGEKEGSNAAKGHQGNINSQLQTYIDCNIPGE